MVALVSFPDGVLIGSMASSLFVPDSNLAVVDFAPNFSNQHNLWVVGFLANYSCQLYSIRKYC